MQYFQRQTNFFFLLFHLAMHTQSKRRNIEQNAEMQPPKNAKLHRMKATNKKNSRERAREKKRVTNYCISAGLLPVRGTATTTSKKRKKIERES